jgi:hypothetical protein
MSDKELIELAAKAAGIEHPGGDHSKYDDGRLWDCNRLRWWNPLLDGSDTLQLGAKLRLNIQHHENFNKSDGYVVVWHGKKHGIMEYYGADPYAATRRAIVRAAAEIGKAMP